LKPGPAANRAAAGAPDGGAGHLSVPPVLIPALTVVLRIETCSGTIPFIPALSALNSFPYSKRNQCDLENNFKPNKPDKRDAADEKARFQPFRVRSDALSSLRLFSVEH
jgi:hypothetical protein